MALTLPFVAVSALLLASGVMVFFSRRLLHSVLALTVAFIGSSIVFIILGQSLAALLQLFVFVGGLSTYLVVAVASDTGRNQPKAAPFSIMLVLIAAALSLPLAREQSGALPVSNSFLPAAGMALSQYYAVLFMMLLLLFSTVIGSILLMKRFIKLVI